MSAQRFPSLPPGELCSERTKISSRRPEILYRSNIMYRLKILASPRPDNWKCHPWLADWGQGTQSTSECLLQESPSRTEHSTRFSQPYHLIVTYRKKRPLVFQREHDSDKHSPTGRVPSICRTIPGWNTLDSSIAQAGLFDKFKSRLAPPAL